NDGYAMLTCLYDRYHQVIEQSFFDPSGLPATSVEHCYSTVRKQYDEVGNVVWEAYYDANKQPALCEEGYAGIHCEYNGNGLVAKETRYDAQQQIMMTEDGYASVMREYDLFEHISSERYYDSNGQPIMNALGYAHLTRISDEQGRVLSERYYDLADAPVLNSYGIAGFDNQYQYIAGFDNQYQHDEEKKKLVGSRCLGLDEQPILNKLGYYEVAWTYSDSDQMLTEQYLGLNGEPVACTYGYAQIARIVNPSGWVLRESYLGLQGEYAINQQVSYAIRMLTYNNDGQLVEEKFCDSNDRLMTLPNGIAFVEYAYDENGILQQTEYTDMSGVTLNIADEDFYVSDIETEVALFARQKQ
ncbi:MAG: hypothetical protein RSC40_06205, partial [Clostridia bacterium]